MRRFLIVGLFVAMACDGDGASAATDPGEESASTSEAEADTGETDASESDTGSPELPDLPPEDPENPSFDDPRPLNIAHRGGADEVPEHTLLAYAHAIEVGADVIEIDLQLTLDGVPVALHDDTVDRTTEGSGLASELTLAELQALDAGYDFTPDGGLSFPHRGTGLTIPSFAEILDAHPGELLAVEIKSESLKIVTPIVSAIAEHDAYADVYLWSGDPGVTQALRDADSQLEVGLTFAEMLTLAGMADEDEDSYEPPGRFAQIPLDLNGFEVLDAALVERCGRVGITVHAWTINDAADMAELIAWGVDGIISDRPSTLEEVLNAEGWP